MLTAFKNIYISAQSVECVKLAIFGKLTWTCPSELSRFFYDHLEGFKKVFCVTRT